jgi:Flp pilus assembly pilin Flp
MKNIWQKAKQFWKDENGLGTIEILLILVVLIAIAIFFGKEIVEWVKKLIGQGENQINSFNPQDDLTN